MKLDACINGMIGTSVIFCSVGSMRLLKDLDSSKCAQWNLNMGLSVAALTGTMMIIREFL